MSVLDAEDMAIIKRIQQELKSVHPEDIEPGTKQGAIYWNKKQYLSRLESAHAQLLGRMHLSKSIADSRKIEEAHHVAQLDARDEYYENMRKIAAAFKSQSAGGRKRSDW
jgi:hypothetical protein